MSILQLECLSLINLLFDAIDSVEERFHMRTEFMKMGFQTLLQQLKLEVEATLLQVEVENFEEETKRDFEDMLASHSRQE